MKIFTSYARVDKPVCIQIVNTLSAHEVWYDQRLYAGQHWWREILRRLEWCDVFIYLISNESLASQYCQKELEIAYKFEKIILPVLIDKNASLPQELEELQYVDMTDQLDVDNVSLLHNSLSIATQYANDYINAPMIGKKRDKRKTNELRLLIEETTDLIGEAAKAFENGAYDKSILLFKQAQAKGFESRFINIEKMLKAAEKAIEEQTRLREADREYQQIVKLFEYSTMREFACEAFLQFHEVYPEYDPQNLASECLAPVETTIVETTSAETQLLNNEVLPMLQWCEIPEGRVHLTNAQAYGDQIGERTVRVPAFLMSKYPVTNEQYQYFISADDGYSNLRWWQFSDYALAWFEAHQEALASRYEGNDRPRENISWYEAIAYTRWLSHKTNANITLPRVAQWQRAAQGDDNRFYPWGNIFNDTYCNTHESQIKCTTSVTHYEAGVSPFGVYDLSGNVWEWCLDRTHPDEGSFDYKRAVLGGSFVSPADRAQISFRYYLKPEVRYSSIGFRLVCLPRNANLST